MKKIIIFFIFLLLFTSLFPDDIIEIRDIKPPEQLKGTHFFPLFVGAKWEWNIKGLGNLTKATWEIVSAHMITDISKNISNSVAFKLKATYKDEEKEFIDEWYILEYNGYICFYKKSRNDYYIEKIIPLDPDINDNWMNASNKLEVAEITNSRIKIELKNEELGRYGYQVFVKDMGPYEIFDALSIDDKKQQMLMSLDNSISYKDVPIIKNDEFPELIKKEEEKTTPNITEENDKVDEDKDQFTVSEDDYIYSLSKDKKYFQIGSFKINSNAKELIIKSKQAGFVPKIFLDKDEQYKVLIEFSKEKSIIEKEIKNKLGITPFLKQ